MFHSSLEVQGISSLRGYTLTSHAYFFSGAGAGFSGAGAAFSGAGAAGLASSFGAGGFGGSADGPQPISVKLAKNVIAINNTTSFFIYFHLLSLLF
jgi:hypothetical protein